MKHARISGYLLLLTGFLHTLIGLVDGYPQLLEMARDGFINTATASFERQVIFWFLVCGIALFLAGLLALGYDRPLPASFGWSLLLLSVIGALVLGLSGFYLLIPQAIYILVVAYRTTRNCERRTV
jgi:Family of unknown function (DUF6463)